MVTAKRLLFLCSKRSAALTSWILSVAFLISITHVANGQALEDLKHSEAYRKLEFDRAPSQNSALRGRKSNEILSNYDSLWRSARGAKLLLQWVEAQIPQYRLEVFTSGVRNEYLGVEATLRNRDKIEVAMTIQVPMPLYRAMAEQKTLASFNRFRPPALEVVGGQKVEIQGISVDYFRHRDGPCSLLIPIAQQGIINLRVLSCTQSSVMFDVANLLNINRLNEKLNS